MPLGLSERQIKQDYLPLGQPDPRRGGRGRQRASGSSSCEGAKYCDRLAATLLLLAPPAASGMGGVADNPPLQPPQPQLILAALRLITTGQMFDTLSPNHTQHSVTICCLNSFQGDVKPRRRSSQPRSLLGLIVFLSHLTPCPSRLSLRLPLSLPPVCWVAFCCLRASVTNAIQIISGKIAFLSGSGTREPQLKEKYL